MRTSAQPLRTAVAISAKYTAIFDDTGGTLCPTASVCDTADTARIQRMQPYSYTAYTARHPTSALSYQCTQVPKLEYPLSAAQRRCRSTASRLYIIFYSFSASVWPLQRTQSVPRPQALHSVCSA